MGLSGREMLNALLGRSTDTVAIAELARGKMRAKRGLLERALAGRMEAHQRFLLTEHLCHIDALDEGIAQVSGEIAERMRPFFLRRSSGWTPSQASASGWPRFWWPKSASTWAASQVRLAGMCPGNQASSGCA
jgi:hypothetical protein